MARSLKRGNTPADMQREIERLNSVRIDWRTEMAEFVRTLRSSRNDWTRSARRHALAKAFHPKKRVNDVGLVVYVRDTSGSIGGVILSEFTGLISQACNSTSSDAIVLDADAEVCGEYRISKGEDIPALAKGGGGTDFNPAFARVQQMIDDGENIAGMVYLTDLDGPEPSKDSVHFPVLWLCTSHTVAKTGRTVRVHI